MTLRVPLTDGDQSTRLQFVDSVDDDRVAGRDPAADRGVVSLGQLDLDLSHLDRFVRFDGVDKGRLGAALDRGGRDDHGVVKGIEQKPGVDKLIREERIVLVWKQGLDPDRPRRRIDLVVDRQDRPLRQFVLEVAVIGLHLEVTAGVHLL